VTLTVTAVEVDEQLTNLEDSLSLSRTLWILIKEWVTVKQKWVVIPVEMLEISKVQQHIQKMQERTYSIESGTCEHCLNIHVYVLYLHNIDFRYTNEVHSGTHKCLLAPVIVCFQIR